MQRITFGKALIALLLILLGILLLFVNIGLITWGDFSGFLGYYPLLLILVGLWLLILRSLFGRHRPKWFVGLFLIVYGGLLFADHQGYIEFEWTSFWKLWPFLVIYIGCQMLRGKGTIIFQMNDKKSEGHTFNFVKDVSYKEPNWPVEPINAHTKIADYDMDFTQAFIPDQETPITLSGWVGDIQLTIPEDVAFSVEGKTNVADVKIGSYKQEGIGKGIHYKTTGYDLATKKLTFTFNFKVLDLRIDRV